jgi:hypothetical protein
VGVRVTDPEIARLLVVIRSGAWGWGGSATGSLVGAGA